MFEHAEHADDVWVLELSQHLRFAHKPFQADAKDFLFFCRNRLHRAITAARGECKGQILLYGNQLTKILIPGQVGNAEASSA